ncbi:hypothetical protein Ahy_A06g028143 [Arachis hypogaea]|uniref:Uncharacterized protein n=1 Tax=Arachis hypogaea TaxID=3818 RepID=A0A445CQK5_ARAHY|nr:hypothetical protein Ahy_A06g028143 [Arachis hypogaea]
MAEKVGDRKSGGSSLQQVGNQTLISTACCLLPLCDDLLLLPLSLRLCSRKALSSLMTTSLLLLLFIIIILFLISSHRCPPLNAHPPPQLSLLAMRFMLLWQVDYYGKGEEKGGGGTSGQGHPSEVETHDQESKTLVVSKVPLPDYCADLDERHGSTQKELISDITDPKTTKMLKFLVFKIKMPI